MGDQSKKYDVIIIGGGVVGCATARELSRYQLKVALLEKEEDVARGTSCRNSGVVHAGFNNEPGMLTAELCVEGNQGFETLARELDIPYARTGKIVVARNERELERIKLLKDQGDKNGVKGLEIIGPEEIERLEPNARGIAALYSPETGIVTPYLMTIALAENAYENGVDFFLNREVISIEHLEEGTNNDRAGRGFIVKTGNSKEDEIESFKATYLINSAGLKADSIARMVGIDKYRIYPNRGEYYVLDKEAADIISRPVYPPPPEEGGGLGVHITPTIEGNILIGPSANYIEDKDDLATTPEVMKALIEESHSFLPQISPHYIIRSFAGLRAKQSPPGVGGYIDFVVEESSEIENFINLIGIESPGITASVPIARRVVGILKEKINLTADPDFNPNRKAKPRFADLSREDQEELIKEDPDYGEIICRCEQVTRKEILDALNNPFGARSLLAVKYRTRAMMGRCQGGYCLSRIVDILKEEYGLSPEEITLKGKDSNLLEGYRSQGGSHS